MGVDEVLCLSRMILIFQQSKKLNWFQSVSLYCILIVWRNEAAHLTKWLRVWALESDSGGLNHFSVT